MYLSVPHNSHQLGLLLGLVLDFQYTTSVTQIRVEALGSEMLYDALVVIAAPVSTSNVTGFSLIEIVTI